MIITEKLASAASLTVSDTPSRATDPLRAMKRESSAGTQNVSFAMSVKSSQSPGFRKEPPGC